jgi:hypothetical protein
MRAPLMGGSLKIYLWKAAAQTMCGVYINSSHGLTGSMMRRRFIEFELSTITVKLDSLDAEFTRYQPQMATLMGLISV